MASCVVSSIRQPPGSHCRSETHRGNTSTIHLKHVVKMWQNVKKKKKKVWIFLQETEYHLLIPIFSQEINRFSRVADYFSFYKSDVEARGVVVDKLKQEHLHRQAVLVVSSGPRKLCRYMRDWIFKKCSTQEKIKNKQARVKHRLTKVCDPDSHTFVKHIEDHDHNEADEAGCDRGGHLWRYILLYRL